jgi:hypothetical protein
MRPTADSRHSVTSVGRSFGGLRIICRTAAVTESIVLLVVIIITVVIIVVSIVVVVVVLALAHRGPVHLLQNAAPAPASVLERRCMAAHQLLHVEEVFFGVTKAFELVPGHEKYKHTGWVGRVELVVLRAERLNDSRAAGATTT